MSNPNYPALAGIIKRDGSVEPYDIEKIRAAILKAFLNDESGNKRPGGDSAASRDASEKLAQDVNRALSRQGVANVHIETVQDHVELALMRAGEHLVARGYVLYRQRRAASRSPSPSSAAGGRIIKVKGAAGEFNADREHVANRFQRAAGAALTADECNQLADAVLRDCFDGIAERDFEHALVLVARQNIERDPKFSTVAAALVMEFLQVEAGTCLKSPVESYATYFRDYLEHAVAIELVDPELKRFDVARLANALKGERDKTFGLLGIETLRDRYLLTDRVTEATPMTFELPQAFFMRVAMGAAINEVDRDARAIEFYEELSSFNFMTSTPTLFNSGTRRPQLSSCFLTTIPDDLDGIYEGIKENALLSKYAGGLGNDWTQVRSMGSLIKGTNGESQGVVPFLKVANDTAVAVNQGGKRKGAVCAYLESWHLDIEEFLELRKNTGDDRRRTHDMNTANWIPDLFMKRVHQEANWTLFSPADVPDLHGHYGTEFEKRYCAYEQKAQRGEIRLFKTVRAVDLWRKMLTMLFETGHPWITFKDPCNIRSPQRHTGVVHSSNLCTEITLNTNEKEIAVCNLASVNLVNHLIKTDGGWVLDTAKLQRTVFVAMRMLDNVIDVNFYTVEKARYSNLKHRPVGLGVMGFHDALQRMGVAFASEAAVAFAAASAEALAYFAYEASCELATERGSYKSFKGSLWAQGILPPDSVGLLADERGEAIDVPINLTLNWKRLSERIVRNGMRNSNCIAIAPTATIANIVGASAGIDPHYKNLYVKSNLGGEFTVINPLLVEELKALGLWDDVMVADLKHFDGSVEKIDRVPAAIKARFATAFEIDPMWLVRSAAARQVFIDQSQSLNLYMAGASGKKLDTLYRAAWKQGLKTTYYLRTMAASNAEKSTGSGGELNQVAVAPVVAVPEVLRSCAIDNPECEACQ